MIHISNRPENHQAEVFFTPRVDILETADEWTVYADMPGVKSDAVEIEYHNGELRVRGRRQRSGPRRYLLHGFEAGDYFRSFTVAENMNSEKIHAEVRQGVLIIHLPKSEAVKPRRIEVTSA